MAVEQKTNSLSRPAALEIKYRRSGSPEEIITAAKQESRKKDYL